MTTIPNKPSIARNMEDLNLAAPNNKFHHTVMACTTLLFFFDCVTSYANLGSISGVHPRYYFLAITWMLMLVYVSSEPRTMLSVHKVKVGFFILLLTFVVNAIVVTVLGEHTIAATYIVYVYIQPIVIMFTLSSLFHSSPIKLLYGIVAITTVSVSFSILQSAGFDFAWDVRESLSSMMRGMRNNNRTPGLSVQSVRFAQVMLIGMAIVVTMAFHSTKRHKTWVMLSMAHIFAAFASGTRSAVIATLVILGINTWFRYRQQRLGTVGLTFLGFALLIGIAPLISAASDSRLVSVSDTSAQVRVVFIRIGFNLLSENFWGYGAQSFAALAGSLGVEETLFADAETFAKVGGLESHNYFINLLTYYGIQGFSMLMFFYVATLHQSLKLINSGYEDSKVIGICVICAIAGQWTDGFFHNSGFLNGFTGLSFIFAVLLSEIQRISKRKKICNQT